MRRTGFFARAAVLALLLVCTALPVHADTGPKPSVTINVKGLEGRECYVTLLSTVQSTGPHSSGWKINPYGERYRDPNASHMDKDAPGYSAYCAFLDYEKDDPEGLFFLGEYSFGVVTDTEPFRWGYYPPNTFKVLLYFPETDSFAVTGELAERYAFDSYYTVDLTGLELVPGETVSGLTAAKSYSYAGELLGIAVRAVITAAIELILAWAVFGLRGTKQLRFILLVNLVTQLGLNLGLNWYAYRNGSGYLFLPYLLMELAVVAVELTAYVLWLPELPASKRERLKAVGTYAWFANACSWLAGYGLARILPGFF